MSSQKGGVQPVEQKSPFRRYVEANERLVECYERVKTAEVDGKADSGMLSSCYVYRDQIRDMLKKNELVMSHLIKERVKIMYSWENEQ